MTSSSEAGRIVQKQFPAPVGCSDFQPALVAEEAGSPTPVDVCDRSVESTRTRVSAGEAVARLSHSEPCPLVATNFRSLTDPVYPSIDGNLENHKVSVAGTSFLRPKTRKPRRKSSTPFGP